MALSVTLLLNPPTEVMVTVEVPKAPRVTVMEGLADTEKSGAGVTVRATLVVWTPLFPLIVKLE